MENIPFLKKLTLKNGDNKISVLFLVGLAGILLIFVSSLFPSKPVNKKAQELTSTQTEQQYIENLEIRLTEMLKNISGVGDAKVMITLESTANVIYAQNEQSDNQTQGAQGQDNASNKNSYNSQHVIIEESGDKKPLIETNIMPEIKGVAVVCSGGGDIMVIKNITDLVSALLALPTNRICVTKMI